MRVAAPATESGVESHASAVRRLVDSRAEQGFPPKLSDPSVLARISRAITSTSRRDAKERR
jgi:hypothetical protein